MTAEKIKKEQISKPGKATKKLDVSKALQLKTENNLSYQQISDITGVPRSTIHAALQELLPNDDTKEYQKNQAGILSRLQLQIIQSIDTADIKKAPMGSRVLALAQLIDKERLISGKATDNLAVITFQMPTPDPVPDEFKVEGNVIDVQSGG